MKKEEMVLLSRAFDFLSWLIPRTMSFPRSQRFVVTGRLQGAALDFYEWVVEARGYRGRERLERLRQADVALDKVRLYLRLSVRWEWLNQGQYEHGARMVAELGRLLGGWLRQTRRSVGSGEDKRALDKETKTG